MNAGRMKGLGQMVRQALVGAAVVATMLAALLDAVLPSTTPPDENALIHNFLSRKDAYERLRRMLLEDRAFRAIHQGGADRANVEAVGGGATLPLARYASYERLLIEVGAQAVYRPRDGYDEVCVDQWGGGFAGDTRHVSMCWRNNVPKHTVATLKEFYESEKPHTPAFRPIGGQWYLCADW